MKKIILSTFLAFFAICTPLIADPWDCMSKTEAEALIKHLKKHPYVFDYCDCCDELAREYDNRKLMGHLVKVNKMEIVVCSWDETQFSVSISSTTVIASGYIENGAFVAGSINEEDKSHYAAAWPITLNYTFAYNNGSPSRLYKMIAYKGDDVNCGGLKQFPDPKSIPSSKIQKAYAKYARKKRMALGFGIS